MQGTPTPDPLTRYGLVRARMAELEAEAAAARRLRASVRPARPGLRRRLGVLVVRAGLALAAERRTLVLRAVRAELVDDVAGPIARRR